MGFALRDARPEECALLTDLAMRSKASWGYDADFMAACADVLRVTPHVLAAKHFQVAVTKADAPVGMVAVSPENGVAHLESLFIDPDHFGQGLGRMLFDWACAQAGAMGATRLEIEADPGAEGFYLALGARRIGEAPSEAIPGRVLPLLAVDPTR